MKKEPQEIIGILKEIRYLQPDTTANSILMILMQLLSFIGALVMIAYSVVIYYGSNNEKDLIHQSYLMLIIAFLLLMIWKLTRMVRNRNNYINEINNVVDDK